MKKSRPYKLVAMGGTFDVIHVGHQRLLSEAFRVGDEVLIGVTSDELVRILDKKHPVRPFSERVRDLGQFLKSRGWMSRARLSSLDEQYGPAARRRGLHALIVSKGTLKNGHLLNQLRKKKGLSPLDLHVVDLLRGTDGEPISTTRIRDGKIDLHGRVLRKG